MKTSWQEALEARRQTDDERKAMEAERRDMVPALWASKLAALGFVGMTASGWLLWRRRQDQRRHQEELAMLAMPFDTPMPETNAAGAMARASTDRLHSAPAAPARGPASDTIATVTAMTANQPAAFDWGMHPHEVSVATMPPDAVDMPASWQLIEQQIDGLRGQAPASAGMAVQAMVDGPAQSHAMEVADMLLAAETWMAEHNPKRAADLLQRYMDR